MIYLGTSCIIEKKKKASIRFQSTKIQQLTKKKDT